MTMTFVYDLWAVYFSSVTLTVFVNLMVSLGPLLLCGVRTVVDLPDLKYFLMAPCVHL